MKFNLLALGIVPWVEGDGNLKNAVFAFEYFGGELGFEIEAIGADGHSLDDFAFEYLVARFHICQNGIVKNVGYQCQQFIGEHVPEHRYTVGAPEKA